MADTNSAAWLDTQGAKLRVGPVEKYKPGKGEVLVEVHAVAINPVDWAQQSTGIFIDKYPYLPGCDTAGTVAEIGEGVTHVSPGTRVLAHMDCTSGQARAAFQKYAIAPEIVACPIPDQMSFTDACVMPLAFLTAAAGFYRKDFLALPLPSLKVKNAGKTLLIWGGATSVGCMAIQLAVASGLDVLTTSSPKNFELCKTLGAREVFDYNSDTVVEDVKVALQDRERAGVYEASGTDDGMKKAAQILSSVGGGFMAPVRHPPEDLPSNVQVLWVHAPSYLKDEKESASFVWQQFLPAALKSGQIRSAPKAEVVGKGLDAIQDGLDAWAKGISAKKIVVEL